MLEEYVEINANLKQEMDEMNKRFDKLMDELEEKEAQIEELQKDYLEASDALECAESEVGELKSRIAQKDAKYKALMQKKGSEVADDVIAENERLKAEKKRTKKEHEKALAKLKKAAKEKEDEFQRRLQFNRQPSSETMGVEDMQSAFDELVNDYEGQLAELNAFNEQTIDQLEDRLQQAIADKEEIADGYLVEIERLDLALSEAVSQISEYQNENALLRKHANMSYPTKEQSRKYRSLDQEVLIKDKKEKPIATLPPHTEVLISEIFNSAKTGNSTPSIFQQSMAYIIEPEKYKGWVQLQTFKGLPLLEPVHAGHSTAASLASISYKIDGAFGEGYANERHSLPSAPQMPLPDIGRSRSKSVPEKTFRKTFGLPELRALGTRRTGYEPDAEMYSPSSGRATPSVSDPLMVNKTISAKLRSLPIPMRVHSGQDPPISRAQWNF